LKNHFSALPKVVRQQFVGEVGKFVASRCQVSSGHRIPKVIIIIGKFFTELFAKYKRGHFFCETHG